MFSIIHLLKKIIRVSYGYLRGSIYIIYYSLLKRNVKIRFPLKAYAPLKIIGPGSVYIDRKCSVHLNVFRGLTIVTLNKKSKVFIGKRCMLGGLTIRCSDHVKILEKTMTGVSLVQDMLFVDRDRNKEVTSLHHIPYAQPIIIGENVWVAGQCTILGESHIGNDSVLAFGSFCYNTNIPNYCLASGSPIRRPLSIKKLLTLAH